MCGWFPGTATPLRVYGTWSASAGACGDSQVAGAASRPMRWVLAVRVAVVWKQQRWTVVGAGLPIVTLPKRGRPASAVSVLGSWPDLIILKVKRALNRRRHPRIRLGFPASAASRSLSFTAGPGRASHGQMGDFVSFLGRLVRMGRNRSICGPRAP